MINLKTTCNYLRTSFFSGSRPDLAVESGFDEFAFKEDVYNEVKAFIVDEVKAISKGALPKFERKKNRAAEAVAFFKTKRKA